MLQGLAEVFVEQLDDAHDPVTGRAARRDECTAYLSHVVRHYDAERTADYLLFLHGEF